MLMKGLLFRSREAGPFSEAMQMIIMLPLALLVSNRAQAIVKLNTLSTVFEAGAGLDQGAYVSSVLYPIISLNDPNSFADLGSVGARNVPTNDDLSNTGPNYRASFDCDHSYGTITNTICLTPLLSHLDYQLALRFARLDNKLDDYRNRIIHHGETRFLNLRQACGDTACLEDIYTRRLEELGRIRLE